MADLRIAPGLTLDFCQRLVPAMARSIQLPIYQPEITCAMLLDNLGCQCDRPRWRQLFNM